MPLPSCRCSIGSWSGRGPEIRILLLSHYALPHLGGIETMLDSLARELRARGHEVVHVASDGRRPDDPRPGPVSDEVGVTRVGSLNFLEERLDVPFPVFSPALVGVLAREVAKADVVHAHGFLYMPCVAGLAYARLLARRRGATPVARVLTEQVAHVPYESRLIDGVERAAVATVGRACARCAQAIVTINPRVEAELGRLAPEARMTWIPNCVDTGRFRPPSADERERLRAELGWDERPRVLFVGRLVRRKGADAAVAAARAGGGRFELAVVGPGETRGLEGPDVRLMGAVAPERMAELYRAADALLLPSRGEGFPVAAQEALVSGLPVALAPDEAYAPYLAGAGAGVSEVPDDPAATARLLERLGAEREAVAAHARAAFSPQASAEAHERLYADLLGAH